MPLVRGKATEPGIGVLLLTGLGGASGLSNIDFKKLLLLGAQFMERDVSLQ